jgi:hypothetical protein
MQSDGKSSFIEALLGFQFNIVESGNLLIFFLKFFKKEIGTRRPLIIRMQNNPEMLEPEIFFSKEDWKQYDDKPCPASEVEKEIKKRTFEVCGTDKISHKPIILKVEYKDAANLTVYDTPGFRKSDKDPFGKEIKKMVLKYISKKSRTIVCLEQATVEWCNTQGIFIIIFNLIF